jgi:uncharacterized membrane protein YphA (DoxX/SURF4 family)
MQRPAGTSIAPIFLRVAVGVTFLWAGLGKLEGEMRVSGESAAALANMGLHAARKQAQAPGPVAPSAPAPEPVMPDGQSPQSPHADGPAVDAKPADAVLPEKPATAEGTSAHVYSAAEFLKEIEVKRVYGLALTLHKAAHPVPRADASVPATLWPARLGRGGWPLFFAWSVAIVEVVGGVCVLVGLLTRAGAVALAGVMLGAVWLTEIGPAVQAGTTVLGFIPDRDWLAVDQWKTLLWQFALLMGACALACLGSGALGFDRKLFPPIPPAPTNVKPMM